MISGQFSGLPYEGSGSSQTDQYSSSSRVQSEQTTKTEQTANRSSTRDSSARNVGKKFLDVLNTILGRNKKPVAYVKRGKEVSFEDIPFYDTSGSKLSFEKTEKGQLAIKRKGRPGTRVQREVDGNLKRELALSGNHGVARSIPEFRNRAHQHLRQTEEVRRKILSGEIETPGNKEAILKRQLKAEARANGEVLDAAWLEEVRGHLARNKGGDLKKLKAQINAMNGTASSKEKGEAGAEKQVKQEIELQDPRMPRVKKFAPKVVEASSEHVVKTKAVPGDEAVDALKKAIARGNAKPKQQPVEAERNVVQRIEIQSSKELPKPGEIESKSLEIIRQLKGKGEDTGEDVPTAKKSRRDPVGEMRQSGWRTHAPKGERAEVAVDALRGERARQPEGESLDRAEGRKATAEGGTFKMAAEQNEAAKTSDLAKVQSAQATPSHQGNGSSSQNGSTSGNAAAQQTANNTQLPSRGIENLQQLLTRMESSVRILSAKGSTTLRVTLRPPELGAVSVQIKESNGKYNVRMRVDSEEAARVVEQHAPQIREAMADRGIQLDNVDIRSGHQQQADSFDQFFDGKEGSQKARSGRPTGRDHLSSDDDATAERDNPVLRSLKLGTNTMETVG